MNIREKRMLEILRELKSDYNIIAIKAEFEAEGSRTDELVKLNEIVFRADLPIYIKIGGCEAVRDMDACRILGASGIMAPMIETPFAMSKFIGAIDTVYTPEEQTEIDFIINTETITCFNNLDDIFSVKGIEKIGSIAVGRVDFTASLGYGRDMINGDEVFEKTKVMLEKARAKGIMAGMGGGISLDAIPFIRKLSGIVEKFETRKVVFKYSDDLDIAKALRLSTEFELLYLENKQALYQYMANEDTQRIEMMRKRFEAIKMQTV